MDSDRTLEEMARSIIDGDKDRAVSLARDAVAGGMDLNSVIEQGFVPGIQEVGNLWDKG